MELMAKEPSVRSHAPRRHTQKLNAAIRTLPYSCVALAMWHGIGRSMFCALDLSCTDVQGWINLSMGEEAEKRLRRGAR